MIRPDPDKVAAYATPPHATGYTARDVILYALGLGLGADPVDHDELPFVYEEWGPKVLPCFATVLGDPLLWLSDPAFGLGGAPNVHGDETLEIHRPIPAQGAVRGQTRVVGLYDRGEGSHGILVTEDTLVDQASGEALATRRQTAVLLGAGGFGSDLPPKLDRPVMPERTPDHRVERLVPRQAALLYRLSGDYYKIHADPEFARQAGFDGPILHGLATYGIACHAVVAACCDHDPDAIGRFYGRVSAPVYPGERLGTEMWREGQQIFFRVRALARDAVVIDNGRVDLRN